MSDVKRYGHISYLVDATPAILQLYPSMTVYVMATDYDALKAENESLRKDAERHAWTGIIGNWVMCHLGKWRASVNEKTVTDWCDSRDAAIDAAISSPENH